MNAVGSQTIDVVATARVGDDGRLLTADPAITALNKRAGGAADGCLAVPALATVARLARRLDIAVSRAVVIADEEGDLDLWVRAEPEADAVRLIVSGWRDLPAWRPLTSPGAPALSGDWQWDTDGSLRLTRLSLDAAAAMGVDGAALLGQPLGAVFALAVDDRDLAQKLPLRDCPSTIMANGRRVLLSAQARRDMTGAFAGIVGTLRLDEDSPGPAEPALPQNFTGGLDRALRAPLARIVANADSMSAQADGPIAPAYADYAGDIASAGRHLLALIDDLVDLQAIERPDFVLAVETIDLADVARRAAGLLSVRAADAQVTLSRPALDAAVPARGDFRRALQIAVNLLGNAIRYSPVGATVRIDAGGESGRATLIVADQGKGIAAADQARIFDKFARLDVGEEGGNGLGLYIARRLARAMGGDLSVVSAAGEGAQFTLTLAAG